MEVKEEITSILNSTEDNISKIDSGVFYGLAGQLADLVEGQDNSILGNHLWENIATLGSLLEDLGTNQRYAAMTLQKIRDSLKES